MLGIVFTEFLDMVEDKFDLDTVDAILDDANVKSGGAYTAVGSYDHQEVVALVVALSRRTSVPIDDLIHTFGHHLTGRFAQLYPSFFENISDPFDFLETVDQHIHREVKKLYPNAQLPTISTERIDEQTMVVTYRSHRSFGKLAEGLIQGSLDHFNCQATLQMEDTSTGDASTARFVITKKSE